LDDFIYKRDLEPLVLLADIIKIDFRKESQFKIDSAVRKLRQYRARLLAEKVETVCRFRLISRQLFLKGGNDLGRPIVRPIGSTYYKKIEMGLSPYNVSNGCCQ